MGEWTGLLKLISHKLGITACKLLHEGVVTSSELLELAMSGLWIAFEMGVLVAVVI